MIGAVDPMRPEQIHHETALFGRTERFPDHKFYYSQDAMKMSVMDKDPLKKHT